MTNHIPLEAFAPPFDPDTFSDNDREALAPFFTNLTQSVYAPLIGSPEVIGALCSRTSRAAGDLRKIFLEEYLLPFLDNTSQDPTAAAYGEELRQYITFLQEHPTEKIFSNPRARAFYTKWLAQYGDDSIAQMAGMHVVYSSLSQIAIKHFEDQRIGLAPLEKSTRYVDYSGKIAGHFKYYTDPTLHELDLEDDYRSAMDGLFQTYIDLTPTLHAHLRQTFPQEKDSVIEKKVFDTLRGLLPVSTLSQVAFYGNGQAFEYLVARSQEHPVGEIRWAASKTLDELYKIAPSFVRRLKSEDSQEISKDYQRYMVGRGQRASRPAQAHIPASQLQGKNTLSPQVELIEYDPDGEDKVITGILYHADNNHASWAETLDSVKKLSSGEKKSIISSYLDGRTQRWQKVGRAFENAFVRYDITINIGAWRDLHRHRMLTQQRQFFTTVHGYDTPPEIIDADLAKPFQSAIQAAEKVFQDITAHNPHLAQYAVTLAHRMRFQQYQNLRSAFWEIELRTIPEGHSDYRYIEQEKFKLLKKAYPLIAEHMHVNLDSYDFARRGQDEKIQAKLKDLEKLNATV